MFLVEARVSPPENHARPPSYRHSLVSIARVIALAVGITISPPASAQAAPVVILLADNYAADQRDVLEREIAAAMERLRRGDRLIVLSTRGERIAEISVPEQRAYEPGSRHLIRLLQPAFQLVRTHLARAVTAGSPSDGTTPSQLRLPTLIDQFGYLAAGGTLRIMAIGSPFYDDPALPAFSFRAGFPEGNHASQPVTVSPFGLAGRQGTIPMQLHICSTETQWVTEAHRQGVQGFWAAWVAHLGGSLATMSDLATCRERFLQGATAGAPVPAVPNPAAPPVMRSVDMTLTVPAAPTTGPAPVPVVAPLAVIGPQQAALLERIVLNPQERTALQPLVAAGHVRLIEMIAWDSDQEDGDIIGVHSPTGGIVHIELRKAPQQVVVPVTAEGIRVEGIRDGAGGGITLALRVVDGGQEVRLPRLVPGQVLQVPVRGR